MGLPSDPLVLLVDDDPDYLTTIRLLLSRSPVKVMTASSGLHALDILRAHSAHVVVSDYWMLGMDGIRLLSEVERLYPKTRRVLLTGSPDSEIVLEGRSLHRVLTKNMISDIILQGIMREVRRYDG